MLVSSDDSAIRILKGEQSIFEVAEKAAVRFVEKIDNKSFIFRLANGGYGVYNQKKR